MPLSTTIHVSDLGAGFYRARTRCGSCRLEVEINVAECERAELPELVERTRLALEALWDGCAPCHGLRAGAVYSVEAVPRGVSVYGAQ